LPDEVSKVKSIRRVSTREARANFSDLLGQVHYTGVPVIVEKKGKPFAVVVSLEDYEWLRRAEDRVWATIEEVQERNADKDPDEVLHDATAEVEAVRQEIDAEGRAAAKGRH
jgi:prevent-host-death family protein